MKESSQVKITQKINFLSFPAGVELSTELWRTHGEQGRKLGSYVLHMSCHTAKLKYVEMIM